MTLGHTTARGLTALTAATAWYGVLLQLYLSLRLSVANGKTLAEGFLTFFGYFTILTNILVALALTVPLVFPRSTAGRFFERPGVRTAIAAAIALVGVVYFLVLRTLWDPRGWQLVADTTLHYVTPILFLFHWWLIVPKHGLQWTQVPAWATYPIAYLGYMLVRGKVIGVYPYPFLDAGTLGYPRTLVNGLGVLAIFLAIAGILLALARLQRFARVAHE